MKNKLIFIKTKKAPAAIGPYSQGIIAGNLIFCSGQVGLDPNTGQLVEGGINEQTKQVLKNLSEILIEANSNINNVIKTEIYLTDIFQFEIVNKLYGDFFKQNPRPTRVTVEVSKLPKNALIEISCIALVKDKN